MKILQNALVLDVTFVYGIDYKALQKIHFIYFDSAPRYKNAQILNAQDSQELLNQILQSVTFYENHNLRLTVSYIFQMQMLRPIAGNIFEAMTKLLEYYAVVVHSFFAQDSQVIIWLGFKNLGLEKLVKGIFPELHFHVTQQCHCVEY